MQACLTDLLTADTRGCPAVFFLRSVGQCHAKSTGRVLVHLD